jgi:hypothetical protein
MISRAVGKPEEPNDSDSYRGIMDAASAVRDRYLPARARQIALSRVLTVVSRELDRYRHTVAAFEEVLKKATAAADSAAAAVGALADVAKSIEIDVGDEALKEPLAHAVESAVKEVFESFGFDVKPTGPPPGIPGGPRSPPTHGMTTSTPRRALVAPPPPAATEPEAPPLVAAPPPPAAPTANGAAPAAPAPAVVAPPPPAPSGSINTVTPRARRALRAVREGAKDAQGVTHRADAMTDENGDRIPVSEQIVVDDVPPEPGSGREAEDGAAAPKTNAEEGDD